MAESAIVPQEIAKRRTWLRNPDIWAAGILVVLGVLFFSDSLFSSKNFYFRDILNFHYPLRKFLIESYARGEFPLWNPFVYLGQPMLANPNYLAFYPTNLLHLFLPFNYAFKLHFILHPILAGLGIYFLQRRLRVPPAPALAGAIAYEFSGPVLSFLNLYNIIPAVALLPWIAWSFAGALEKNPFRRSLVFGALLALQVIAFEPLIFQCTVALLAGLAVSHVVESSDRMRAIGRSLRTGLVGGLFASGLAAVQILSTLELLSRTGRGSGMDFVEASVRSMHPLDLLNSVIPNLFGNYYTLNFATSWGESIHQGRESYLVSFFLGVFTLLLAVLSIFSEHRRLRTVMACLTLAGLALAFGKYNSVYHWLFDHVAFFRFGRYPSKCFLLVALSLSVMASLGFEVVLRINQLASHVRRRIVAVGICGLILGFVFLAYWITWPSHVPQLERWIGTKVREDLRATKDMPAILAQIERSVLSSGAFLLRGSVLVLVAPVWRRPSVMSGLMLLLIAAELLPAHLRLSPLISDADVDFVPEVNKYLSSRGSQGIYRVVPPTLLGPTRGIQLRAPNRSSAWLILFYRLSGQPYGGIMNGIQYSLDRTVDCLGTMESEEIRKACTSMSESQALTPLAKLNSPMILAIGELHDPRVRLLASFGTESNQNLNLYWLEKTIDRAVFVTNVETASSPAEAFRKFIQPDFPIASTVVLEDPRPEGEFGLLSAGTSIIEHYENQRVVCRVNAGRAGYLVLFDSYYPGWNAYLDGVKVEILRADYAFRAVAEPAGSHSVESRYRPATFFWGLAFSLIALFFGLVVAASSAVRP
jgi:hypothetical protein